MGKDRVRVCLQDGLKLDLNTLAKKGFIRHGANIGLRGITWTHSYWGDVATGLIMADMTAPHEGWLRIQLGSLDQRITLVSEKRHFGGRQWYFICPVKNRRVSVLWKLNGATRFCSRQTWGRRVAYQSQFNDATNRAHAQGSSRAKASEMEHAIRKHCTIHFDEDPAFFKRMSEKLDTLIAKHGDDWKALAERYEELRSEIRAGRGEAIAEHPPKCSYFVKTSTT